MSQKSWSNDENFPRKDQLAEEKTRGKQFRRKDTKRWCAGHVGREHDYQIRVSTAGWRADRPCQWWPMHVWIPGTLRSEWEVDWRYLCRHELACTKCGKIAVHFPSNQCPLRTPRPEGKPDHVE